MWDIINNIIHDISQGYLSIVIPVLTNAMTTGY